MRIAISGSHSTGKSTLIGRFLDQCPHYTEEPEAFEILGDDITILPGEGPDLDGLEALLDLTLSTLSKYPPNADVIFERSPVDYLAYAAASRSIEEAERAEFLDAHLPAVRDAVRHLDLIALLPVFDEGPIRGRSGENEDFRQRVDDELRSLLLDDEAGLFAGDASSSGGAPTVLELPPLPEQQLATLLRALL